MSNETGGLRRPVRIKRLSLVEGQDPVCRYLSVCREMSHAKIGYSRKAPKIEVPLLRLAGRLRAFFAELKREAESFVAMAEPRRPVRIGHSKPGGRKRAVDCYLWDFRPGDDFAIPQAEIPEGRFLAVHSVLLDVLIRRRRPVFINNARGGERHRQIAGWNERYRQYSPMVYEWQTAPRDKLIELDMCVDDAIGAGGWTFRDAV